MIYTWWSEGRCRIPCSVVAHYILLIQLFHPPGERKDKALFLDTSTLDVVFALAIYADNAPRRSSRKLLVCWRLRLEPVGRRQTPQHPDPAQNGITLTSCFCAVADSIGKSESTRPQSADTRTHSTTRSRPAETDTSQRYAPQRLT